MRLTVRRQPARCSCMNGPDAPSTHRGADHTNPDCPHSTLPETTGGYERKRRAIERARTAKRARRPAPLPVRRVVR